MHPLFYTLCSGPASQESDHLAGVRAAGQAKTGTGPPAGKDQGSKRNQASAREKTMGSRHNFTGRPHIHT